MFKQHVLHHNHPRLILMLKQHVLHHNHHRLILMLKQQALQHNLPGAGLVVST
jgi:hypothetical protein